MHIMYNKNILMNLQLFLLSAKKDYPKYLDRKGHFRGGGMSNACSVCISLLFANS